MIERNVGWYRGVGFEVGEAGARLVPAGPPNRRRRDPGVPRDGGHAVDPAAGRVLRRSEDPLLVGDPSYARNLCRHDLWRAGHARVGVLLVLSLAALRCVGVARLPDDAKRLVRRLIPAAILLPLASFLPAFSREPTEPNAKIYVAYVGTVSLTVGLFVPGIGLVRRSLRSREGRRRDAP